MASSKNIVTTPKSSPVKSNSSSNKKVQSPNKSVESPNKLIQTSLVLNKLKSPSISPKKCDIEKNMSNSEIESLEKTFHSNDEDRKSVKTSSKRKISPIKTPENKKFKNDTVPSPDTQVSIMIIILLIEFYIMIEILGKWIYNRCIYIIVHCIFYF